MIVVPLLLLLARRRLDAAKVFCMLAEAFALAEVGKKLINEHRSSATLQVVAADSGASFPSEHTITTAAELDDREIAAADLARQIWDLHALGSRPGESSGKVAGMAAGPGLNWERRPMHC